MQTFKIKEGGFKEIKKQLLIKAIPILLITVIFSIIVFVINLKSNSTGLNVLPVIIPFVTVLVGFGLYRGVSRQKFLFESYTLTISDNLVVREQLNTQTISIYFNDIKEITRQKNGSFTIKGKQDVALISIPAQIDDYLQLEITLQQIQPVILKNNTSSLQKYQYLIIIATIGLMLGVYTSSNKIIVGLTGSTLIVLMIWNIISIAGSKDIDRKTKGIIMWIVFVLISVIIVMAIKLTGFEINS